MRRKQKLATEIKFETGFEDANDLNGPRRGSCAELTRSKKSRRKTRPAPRSWSSVSLAVKVPDTCGGGCSCERQAGRWTTLLRHIASWVWMVRLRHASPRPVHPPGNVRRWMQPNVPTQAVQGPCARRGDAIACLRSGYGVLGAHRSAERLSADAEHGHGGLKSSAALKDAPMLPSSPDLLTAPEAP